VFQNRLNKIVLSFENFVAHQDYLRKKSCSFMAQVQLVLLQWGKHDINAELRERLQDLFIPMQQDASGELSRSKCHRYNFSITPNVLESNFSGNTPNVTFSDY